MKLTSLRFLTGNPPLPGFREIGKGQYERWTVHVRGPAVFLVSPPGWHLGKPASGSNRVAHEVPRTSCAITWDIEDGEDLKATGTWSPPACRIDHTPLDHEHAPCPTCAVRDRATHEALKLKHESSQPAAGEPPIVTAPAAAPRRGKQKQEQAE